VANERKRVRLIPLYSCADMCDRKDGNPGEHRLRAARRCSLPDFDRADWDPTADKVAAGEAAWSAKEISDNAKAQGSTLGHDLDVDGCPWGWAQSRFVISVADYLGPRGQDSPMRTPSAKLQWRIAHDETMPARLFDAVALLAAYEDSSWAYFHDVVNG
jgi:hypothetical protein